MTEPSSDPTPPWQGLPRLTVDWLRAILAVNDGLTSRTHYDGKNFSESRNYRVEDGELHIRSHSKTSWADSSATSEHVADDDQARRFLKSMGARVNLDGAEELAAQFKQEGAIGGCSRGA